MIYIFSVCKRESWEICWENLWRMWKSRAEGFFFFFLAGNVRTLPNSSLGWGNFALQELPAHSIRQVVRPPPGSLAYLSSICCVSITLYSNMYDVSLLPCILTCCVSISLHSHIPCLYNLAFSYFVSLLPCILIFYFCIIWHCHILSKEAGAEEPLAEVLEVTEASEVGRLRTAVGPPAGCPISKKWISEKS